MKFSPIALTLAAIILAAGSILSGCKAGEDRKPGEVAGEDGGRSRRARDSPENAALRKAVPAGRSPGGSDSAAIKALRAVVVKKLTDLNGESAEDLQTTYRSQLNELDGDFARLPFRDIPDILKESGFADKSNASFVLLYHILRAKAGVDPHGTRQFLLERGDPSLADFCLRSLSASSPSDALEVVERLQPAHPDYSFVFEAAAATHQDEALSLIREIEHPEGRAAAASGFIGGMSHDADTPARLKSVLAGNLDVFSSKDPTDLLLKAGKHLTDLPMDQVFGNFDPAIDWQRHVLLGYLNGQTQDHAAEVAAYLQSPSARNFTTAELEDLEKKLSEKE